MSESIKWGRAEMGLQALMVGEGILMKGKSANGGDWSTALYDWSTALR